jgi:single-stranded DNA-binding protein
MNRVELVGGLTRPPDLRFTQGGMGICEASLAVNGARYDSEARSQVVTTVYVARW